MYISHELQVKKASVQYFFIFVTSSEEKLVQSQ